MKFMVGSYVSFKKTFALEITLLILVIFLNSCIEKFDYESPSDEKYLVVSGGITQKNTIHGLNLNYSTYYGSLYSQKVIHAKIRLFDENGDYEDYHEQEEGEYYLYGNILQRKPGISYYLEIELVNGNIYRSISQIMPEVIKADSLYSRRKIISEISESGTVIKKNQLEILINTPVKYDNQDGYIIWRSDHVYSLTEIKCHPLVYPHVCYGKQLLNPDEIFIFSGENTEGKLLMDHMVGNLYIEPFWQFFEKHFYNVGQFSVTKETYRYWETVKKIANPTGSIFDTPPAPVKGNIYNLNDPEEMVLGYFEVSAVDTIRTWTNYSHFRPMAIYDRCNEEFPHLAFGDPACCNCFNNLDHVSNDRPYYWGD